MTDEAVPRLELTVDENDVVRGATEVLRVIRPHWLSDSVRFKLFTDGITNKLVGCFNQNNNNAANSDDSDDNSAATDVVLVRVYGNKTDLLIDRKKETENIRLLHRYGYAPALYATFRNGLAYEYVPGVTLTPETVRDERTWPLVARRMAQMHKVTDGTDGARETMLPGKMDQFLKLLPEVFSDPVKHARISKLFPSTAELRRDFDNLYRKLRELDSPTVFCHNDLLLGNVIYNAERGQVTFIDYEYACFNHQAFDIGNHFTEFAGIDEIDYDRYPEKEFQLRWLRVYLEEFRGGPCSDGDVERLYVQVNQFALSSHFLWTVWALIQAEHSTIDFDFIQFGQNRYEEYLRRRDEFLALTYTN